MNVTENKVQQLKDLLINSEKVDKDIAQEMEHATLHYGGFASYYEGYGVLLEEVDELWEEIKDKQSIPENLYKEAIQVAAMAREIALFAVQHVKD